MSPAGRFCEEDVDECSSGNNPCHNGATCKNTAGTYVCYCPTGYGGIHCEINIDDCTPGEQGFNSYANRFLM